MALSTLRGEGPALDTATGTALDIDSLWDVMNELYDVRTKWYMIGLGLRLRPPDLDAMSGNPQDCLKSSLSKWLKGIDPPPTWQAIVAVLRSPLVDEKRKAKELEEKFCRDIPSEAPMKVPRTQSETSESSVGSLESAMSPKSDASSSTFQLSPKSIQFEDGASSEEPMSLSVAESDAEDAARVDDSSPSSRAKPSLLHNVERITDAEVRKKMTRKDNQFRTLLRKTHCHISRTITTQHGIADFQVAISYLPASLHNHHILLSPEDRTAIMEAKSFAQIFVVLNQYWTFVQYELLEYVVQEYGNFRLKKEMKAYVADMDELESQVDLDHFTAVRRCFSRPDSVTMNIHLPGSQRNLRDARRVQRSVAEQNGLHPHTVRTLWSTPGSTILTLLVPYAVAGHVVASFRGMLPAGDLLSRPVEERVVYTMDEAETEMYLPQNVQVHAAALLSMSAVTGRRERRGSGDSSYSGYETMSRVSGDSVSVVEESQSRSAIAVLTSALTSVIQEKDKQVEELQLKLEDSALTLPSGKLPKDSRAVFILGSVAPHSNESVVPQSPAVLSGDDRQVLIELGLPPDKWNNLNVLLTMYNRAELCDVFSVQVGKPGMELSRSYVLEQVEHLLLNSAKKEGAVIQYYGNGRRNTGDWCFRDGFITFRDIAGLYMKHGRGRVLTIISDCHSSGHWVVECAKFLDDQGVRPCGHSATEKGILLRVYAACETGQDTAKLCYTTRAMEVKSDGFMHHWSRKELSDKQKSFGVNFTRVRCGKGEGEECAIASDSTWSTDSEVTSDRLYIIQTTKKGRPAWCYVLLDDDAEKIKEFIHKTQGENAGKYTMKYEDYGTVLMSGWGKGPSQKDKDWMKENYYQKAKKTRQNSGYQPWLELPNPSGQSGWGKGPSQKDKDRMKENYHQEMRQNSGYRPWLELPNPSGPGVQTIQFPVPDNKCGLIIGKGGDTIRQIQMQSGAHVELHHGAQPNPNETLFNIRGTPQQVQVAQQLIRQKYENVPGAGGAGGPPFGPPGLELPNPSGPGVQTIQFPVPDNKCGLIIGKGGDIIRQIQMQSGAHVELHRGAQPNPNETLFNIRGTPQQVQVAQQLIRQKYENVPGAGGAGGPPFGPPGLELPNPSGPGVQTIQFPVPDNKCGLIIGKGGDTIRQIQVQSGAHVELHRGAQPNPYEKLFNVRGTPQQVQVAQQLIRQKYENVPGAGDPPFGHPGGPYQGQQMYGGPQPGPMYGGPGGAPAGDQWRQYPYQQQAAFGAAAATQSQSYGQGEQPRAYYGQGEQPGAYDGQGEQPGAYYGQGEQPGAYYGPDHK